ncbi:hypothetical protein AKAW_00225 [Aspergillus luchuensis IFO 4308]|nr:hypothetical protein AKAW_00225 [Aspergillus luchuensis IFO 4308]
MTASKEIRLFGDLWLPDPGNALPKDELAIVRKLLPLIQRFEEDWYGMAEVPDIAERPSGWNLDEAHEEFIEKEAGWWKSRGVTRPRHLVRPSGELNAPVACHLFNPTFTVDDPHCSETEDFSNPSIAQLKDAGFSSQNNCFLFDHLGRRDNSSHCTDLYPEDLLEIHEEFVFALRHAMKAKVEICWGSNVRKRMIKKCDLQPLRLWGDYAGLVLYLELTPGRQFLKRFIIFVAHPQRFMYVKSDGIKAQGWRHRFGVSQDQALAVAALLGGIQITPNFYTLDSRLPRNLCVPRSTTNERSTWKGQAVAQLRTAFPTSVLSMETSHYVRPTKEERSSVQEAFALLGKFKLAKVNEAANLRSASNDTHLRKKRLQKIADYWHELEELSSIFLPSASTAVQHDNATPGQFVSCHLEDIFTNLQGSDCWDWEDLPDPLVEFIQAQDGLKFNRREISCRNDLELAFNLLQKCKGSPETLDILTLAFLVLDAYGWLISRPRLPQVDGLLILRDPPHDVVPRKCSACGKQYLDDAFAYWSMRNPEYYVLCSQIKYLRSTQKELMEKPLDRFERWFLLRPEEFGDLPIDVKVKCQTKDCQEVKIVKARWTGHVPPRPDIYFDDSLTIDGRVAALIEAQRLMQDEQVGELTN